MGLVVMSQLSLSRSGSCGNQKAVKGQVLIFGLVSLGRRAEFVQTAPEGSSQNTGRQFQKSQISPVCRGE